MKHLLALFAAACTLVASAQQDPKVFVVPCSEFFVIDHLMDIQIPTTIIDEPVMHEINPIRNRKAEGFLQKDFAPDHDLQAEMGQRATSTIVQNFDGMQNNEAGGWMPPDPSGAVGPNHYIQMVNTAMEIFDLEGNSLWGPTFLGDIFPNADDAGDPVVLYDEGADRWFISQFQFDNTIRVGISQTPDPTGAWYWYSFQFPNFPDYPKFSVWSDGYYASSNMGGTNTAVFERAKMLAGDETAQAVLVQTPQQGSSGFRMALPVDLEGAADPGRPAMVINCNDDGWGSQDGDHLRIWEWTLDWDNPNNTSLDVMTTLDVTPFDGVFPGFGWNNIDQPGAPNSLDAIGDGLMFPAKYRDFGSHASMVVCHSVQVDDNGRAGIRWYELRDEGAGWYIFQSGTYAPGNDDLSRWMGSIGIDVAGNISIAYSASSTSVYPSIRFTGRYASDDPGMMTLAECELVAGQGTQSGNRWGDYAQMTVDPVDGFTFWFTGEYTRNSNGAWGTRIGAWRLQEPAAIDLGVLAINTPESGSLTGTETVSVTLRNYGLEDQSNFDVSFQVDGGAVITETYNGTIAAGDQADYTFVGTADLLAYGTHTVAAFTSHPEDGWTPNDMLTKTVVHYFPNDVGVTGLITPVTQQLNTAAEVVTVEIKNYGSTDASNFDVTYVMNGGTPVTETYTGTLAAQASAEFSFATTADLEAIGFYDFELYTALVNDGDPTNDAHMATVETLEPAYCTGTSDCSSYNDAILLVQLNEIDNASECGSNGYTDFTSISTTIEQGGIYDFTGMMGYDDYYWHMWIDLNQDYQFTEDEKFLNAMPTPIANQTATETISFPADLPLGTYRMRVRAQWIESGALDPCANMEWGETEDYTVEVIEGTPDNIAGLPNADFSVTQSSDFSSLTAHFSGTPGNYRLVIIDALGRKVKEQRFTAGDTHVETINTAYLTAGTYVVMVQGDHIRKTQSFVIAR
ncbi:MAG: hypothetical protein KDC12_13910 [Flavobacteriales bacterium]|nr:hypothetical protein [Flavobacteriales bacterium]